MKRRCNFLDHLPAFNYNTGHGEYFIDETGKETTSDIKELGSTLMSTMLREVSDFCNPAIKENWSLKAHQQVDSSTFWVYFMCSQCICMNVMLLCKYLFVLPLQLIYDFRDGGGSFGLLSLHPDKLPDQQRTKFQKIGVRVPSMM